MTKLLTVILPFFNAESTLENAIKSVLNQTFTNFYFVLVNNNSTDKSIEIVKKYALKERRIILLHEKKQGVTFASNKGMQYAKTKYIARADADDILHKNKLEKQIYFLENNSDIDIVGTRVNYIGSTENKGFKAFVDITNKITTNQEIEINRFAELQVINPTIMFRKSVAEKYGYYKNGDFPEDYEMFLRWIDNGVKYYKLDDYLLDWHDSKTRLTRTDERYYFDAFYKIKTPYLAKYLYKNNKYHPKVAIWGAGKLSRKRANLLLDYGIKIEKFIDIDSKKIKQANTIYYNQLSINDKLFILSYVSNRGAKEKIKQFLLEKGFIEGTDFLLIA